MMERMHTGVCQKCNPAVEAGAVEAITSRPTIALHCRLCQTCALLLWNHMTAPNESAGTSGGNPCANITARLFCARASPPSAAAWYLQTSGAAMSHGRRRLL